MWNNGNNFNNRFGRPYPPQDMMPVRTNKIYVVSLEDALSRPCDYNTEIIYIHQNQPIIFEVITDARGIKSYNVYNISKKVEDQTPAAVMRSEYDELRKDVNELKNIVFKEVNKNEPIVQRSDDPVKSEQPL
jgi:hypothetical protein